MATDTSVYMLEEHTGLTGSVAHGTSEARHSCNKFLSYHRDLRTASPCFPVSHRPHSVSSKVSGSSPRLKLRYGRKIYSLDEISLVILFITELHPYM